MPMQPSPRAETSKPLFPSVRFCIVFSFINCGGKTPPLVGGEQSRLPLPVGTNLRSDPKSCRCFLLPRRRMEQQPPSPSTSRTRSLSRNDCRQDLQVQTRPHPRTGNTVRSVCGVSPLGMELGVGAKAISLQTDGQDPRLPCPCRRTG